MSIVSKSLLSCISFFFLFLLSSHAELPLHHVAVGFMNSDTVSKKTIPAEKEVLVENHDPHKAALMSALVPGLGQIYNKKYWKAPIVWGGMATFIYFIGENARQAVVYEEAYFDFVKYIRGMENDESFKNLSELQLAINSWDDLEGRDEEYIKTYLYNSKYNYRRNRDLSIIGTLAVYFLNVIDATVDAHFFNYDVSDDLSLRIEPEVRSTTPYTSAFGFSCRIRF